MTNDIFYSGERHPLLMKCLKSLLRYIWKIRVATESICLPPMGLIMPFPLRSNLKLYTKYQIFLPYWYSKWDDVLQIETSIACEVFQNLSHSLDVYRRWKVLLTASIGYLWITQYHRLQRLALKLHKSGSFEDLSVH